MAQRARVEHNIPTPTLQDGQQGFKLALPYRMEESKFPNIKIIAEDNLLY